jgi:hypothetical protein
MRRAALAIIATCLCVSSSPAVEPSYQLKAYYWQDAYDLMMDFYSYLLVYPSRYIEPEDPCADEEDYNDCTYPGGPAPGSEGGWMDNYNG